MSNRDNSKGFWSHLGKPGFHGIGWKFAKGIIIFSSLVTLLATATTLWMDYRREIGLIDRQLEQIDESFRDSLALSVWNLDSPGLDNQLDGIMAFADVVGVQVASDAGGIGSTRGDIDTDTGLVREFALQHVAWGDTREVATLRIVATRERVLQGLRDRVITILFTQAFKTFLVSLFILYLFHRLVGRHLHAIGRHLDAFDADASDVTPEPILLGRNNPGNSDELDQVVSSFNTLHARLNSASAESRASALMFRTVIEGSPNAIIMVDERGVITLTNPATNHLFGYRAEELLGQPVGMLVSSQGQAGHASWVSRFMQSPSQRRMGSASDLFGLRKDGSEVPLEIGLSPVRINQQRFVVANIVDVSERKARETEIRLFQERLAQAGKMESLGKLTAGIAHDFNNILSAILGFAELSKDRLGVASEEKIREYLQHILKAGNRARELIARMLAFSRQSPPLQELRTTDVAQVVEEVATLLRSTIPSTIDIAVEMEPGPLFARIEPVHLHQVLLNLAVNARDAITGVGCVGIRVWRQACGPASCSSCHDEFAGDMVCIAVRDTGGGMPASVVGRIFDPFYTTKEVGKGTGMGLSMVHGMVHEAGGHLLLDTQEGSGTEFRILLPWAEDAACVETNETADAATGLDGICILVLDDEEALTVLLQEFLERLGASVVVFNDPVAALDFVSASHNRLDLVISDQMMPKLTGMEFCAALRRRNILLPVLLCTAFGKELTTDNLLAAGISDLVRKPIDLQSLLARINRLLADADRMS